MGYVFSVPGKYKITAQQETVYSKHYVLSVSGVILWKVVWARIFTFPWVGKEEMMLWFHEAKPCLKTSKTLICFNYPVNSGDVNCAVFDLLEWEVACVMP